jgi:Bacterial protein of unknown function (DUF885)
MPSTSAADQALGAFAARFLDEYLARNPTRASEVGEHRHDGRWPDLSAQGEAEERRFVAARLEELGRIPEAGLSVQARVDRGVIENQLRYWLFVLDELKEPERNPLGYTSIIGDGLDPLVTRSFAPLPERLASLRARLLGVPALVAVAKQRLQRPPRIYTETAIKQNAGLVSLCEHDLAPTFAKVPALEKDLAAAAAAAAAALRDFQVFLEKDLLPRSDGSFRLGRERFAKKLRFELDDPVAPEALAGAARALLDHTLDEMTETSRELWPTLMGQEPLPPLGTPAERKVAVRRVLDKLAEDRPDNTTILREATTWLAEASRFVREHDLVTMPTEPCQVIEMPEYRRGVTVAYCDASGPLEAKQETFYAISPTPTDWPAKRVESFYREYNRSMLADLTVHEAMPGHFLQLMASNHFPSKLRSVFSSGAFVEGWAVYGEWLMARHGFGGPKVRLQRQKMIARVAANAILDHGVHAGSMDEKAALDLMMNDAFQEEGEAAGKWRRALLSSAQLSTYYYGFSELMKIRADHEKLPGFSERSYHDRLIGSGSPSLRGVRLLMSP